VISCRKSRYELAPTISDHAQGGATGAAVASTTAASLGLGALFPRNAPPPRDGQRLPVFVRNSGRQPGRGEPVGLLVCGCSQQQHHHHHHHSSAGGPDAPPLVWRLALLPFGFPAVVAALRAGSPTTAAAAGGSAGGGGAPATALSDAQLAALVRALPAPHLAPLAAALQLQAQGSTNSNSNGNIINTGSSSGLLRGNRAVAPLLRLLGNALGPGGDAGPSSACRERWRRLTWQAESDVTRATQQVDILAACLPKRLALAQRSQAQRRVRSMLLQAGQGGRGNNNNEGLGGGSSGKRTRDCSSMSSGGGGSGASGNNHKDGDDMSDGDEGDGDGDEDKAEKQDERRKRAEEDKGREEADEAFAQLNLLPATPPCFDAPLPDPFSSTTAGATSPPRGGALPQASENSKSSKNNTDNNSSNSNNSSSSSSSASRNIHGGSGYPTAPLTEQEVLQLPTSHLMARWEAERKRLFGGRGLAVPLLGHCPRDGDPHAATLRFGERAVEKNEHKGRGPGGGGGDRVSKERKGAEGVHQRGPSMPSFNLLQLAGIGFRRVNAEPIASMGAYQAVLAKTQVRVHLMVGYQVQLPQLSVL